MNHRTSSTHSTRARRALVGTIVALATGLGALVPGLATPAVAGPVDAPWTVTSDASGTASRTSDGTTSAASMTYRRDLGIAGGVPATSYEFTTRATSGTEDGPITVPWTWKGLHAWAGVTTKLDLVVGDRVDEMGVVGTLVAEGPVWCCTSPSNGFLYGGTATFDDVSPGQYYGFRIRGSNADYNSFISGTLTLSNKPYLEALGTDNRQWNGAYELGSTPAHGTLDEPGEARWWKIPVLPGEQVSVTVDDLPADYDLALYGDIGAAFDRLGSGSTTADLTKLAAGASATTPGNENPVPQYPSAVTTIPTGPSSVPTSAAFAPRVYAPRVYAPRVYAPRVYAPRVYAPRVYAPRVYAPGSYTPDLTGDPGFRDAFAAAQTQTLLAVSSRPGTAAETVSASTGNATGSFYVRVQAHDDSTFDDTRPFSISRTISGSGRCDDVHGVESDRSVPDVTGQSTVILTDSSRLTFVDDADRESYLDSLDALADRTDGVVADLAHDTAVQALQNQAAVESSCPYAVNLAAESIRDVVDSYRGPDTRYVVIAGGDEVVPFFRYPDTSGLGQESQFELKDGLSGQAETSLVADQVLSQDAYGSSTDLVLGGTTLPVPDLAVGRLVKTPDEIRSTVDHFLEPAGGTVIRPGSSLVTGYDFLADAAGKVQGQVAGGMGVAPDDASAETLVSPYGTPHADSWHADDLRTKLFAKHHDVVFLAGHFSANDTLAADFSTTFGADELAQEDGWSPVTDPDDDSATPRPLLSDTLVVSPGCHSGYTIVDGAADATVATTDWTQRMAQHHAVLVAGTGYQYGDTDFLEYSERLYLGFFEELRRDTGGEPVDVGPALVAAKQDYLATLASLTGIDQKAVLQATLYGLPMAGVDFAQRLQDDPGTSRSAPTAVGSGPGAQLGLFSDDLSVATGIDDLGDAKHKPAYAGGPTLTWFEGADGVTSLPGAPVLPKQVVDVSATGDARGAVLRGVGFRSGSYTQASGLYPLTGAPAIEGTTPHTTFYSPAFFPQRLTDVNYFDALGGRASGGRTSLVLSPAQWRSDPGVTETTDEATGTVRAYSGLGVRLFYSGNTTTYAGGNQPALAGAPALTDVAAVASGGVVQFSARATGDPSAGVQQVWVTWTSGPDEQGHGEWSSVDLTQDPTDSTRWTGTLTLPEGVSRSDVRFVVQAANGIGAVGLDTAEGDGYPVLSLNAADAALSVTVDHPRPHHNGISARVVDSSAQPLAGQAVRFRLTQGGVTLVDGVATTDATGNAPMPDPSAPPAPGGATLVVDLLAPGSTTPVDTVTRTINVEDPARGTLTVVSPITSAAPGISVAVRDVDTGAGLAGRTVRFSLLQAGQTVLTRDVPVDATTFLARFPSGVTLPTGTATLRAEVLPVVTGAPSPWSQESTVTLPKDVLTVSSTVLQTRAGTPYPCLTARLVDANGVALAGRTITFTVVPSGGVTAGFPTAVSRTATTGSDGRATMPTLTAGTAIGTSSLTVSGPRADSVSVGLSSQYGFGAFVSPVLSNGVTKTSAKGTTPVKITALLANGAKLDDATAAALARAGRAQVTWVRTQGTAGAAASTSPVAAAYDASKDFFQADLKASSMGWKQGCSYRVTFTVQDSPDRAGLDLGSRSFVVTVG